jgi:hypothetical protein
MRDEIREVALRGDRPLIKPRQTPNLRGRALRQHVEQRVAEHEANGIVLTEAQRAALGKTVRRVGEYDRLPMMWRRWLRDGHR